MPFWFRAIRGFSLVSLFHLVNLSNKRNINICYLGEVEDDWRPGEASASTEKPAAPGE